MNISYDRVRVLLAKQRDGKLLSAEKDELCQAAGQMAAQIDEWGVRLRQVALAVHAGAKRGDVAQKLDAMPHPNSLNHYLTERGVISATRSAGWPISLHLDGMPMGEELNPDAMSIVLHDLARAVGVPVSVTFYGRIIRHEPQFDRFSTKAQLHDAWRNSQLAATMQAREVRKTQQPVVGMSLRWLDKEVPGGTRKGVKLTKKERVLQVYTTSGWVDVPVAAAE